MVERNYDGLDGANPNKINMVDDDYFFSGGQEPEKTIQVVDMVRRHS